MSHKEGISIYTSGITSLVTICGAGLAAGTALMQIAGTSDNRHWYVIALVAFFIGLLCCFLTMSGLTGQAISQNPDIEVLNIRVPAILSFCMALAGFVLLGTGAFRSSYEKNEEKAGEFMSKLENCRREIFIEKRTQCYDAFFDGRINEMKIVEGDLKNLSPTDQAWIKLMILKSKGR